MTTKIRDLLDFEGTWTLERLIQDRLTGQDSTLTGTAKLTRGADGALDYTEEGELKVPDQPPLTASRSYRWTRKNGGQVAVDFEDGGHFHSFSLNRTMPEATHICSPDMYHVTYDFSKWPAWSAEWRVQGPRKSYRLRSEYRRAP